MKYCDSIKNIYHGKFRYIKFAKLKDLTKNSMDHRDENTDLLISIYVSTIKTFYDYCLKKHSECKYHRITLSHICKRILRVIHLYTREKQH